MGLLSSPKVHHDGWVMLLVRVRAWHSSEAQDQGHTAAQVCPLLSHTPPFRRCCPALVHMDITEESSQGGGWSPPHPTLKARP